MKYHYIEQTLIAPVHKINIVVLGVGGTGSVVLSILARMNMGLMGLGHPGFFVTSFDNDIVTDSNIGRQLFSISDLGKNKSDVIMERINRFYGTNWDSVNSNYTVNESDGIPYNIIITCVDNMEIRKDIQKAKFSGISNIPYQNLYYWLDFGNGKDYGQAILGTMSNIEQPKGYNSKEKKISILPTIIEELKGSTVETNENEPSCSTREALNRQDLLVNSTLSEFGMNLLWKLFRNYKTSQRGVYMNLDNMSVNPIKL